MSEWPSRRFSLLMSSSGDCSYKLSRTSLFTIVGPKQSKRYLLLILLRYLFVKASCYIASHLLLCVVSWFFFFFSPSQTCTSLTCHSMVDEKCWYFVNIYLLYWKIIITFSHGDFGFSRSSDVATRQKYVNLVDSVKASGGSAHIFSSMHVSGERECNSAFIFSLGSYWRKLFLSWLT